MTGPRFIPVCVLAAMLLHAYVAQAAEPQAAEPRAGGDRNGSRSVERALPAQRIEAAEKAGAAFLLKQIAKDGRVSGECDTANPRFGGRTALCAYALLSAGVNHKQPDLQRALRWLTAAKLHGTYAVAMRACALSAVKDSVVLPALKADAAWLVRAAASNGAYTYTSCDGKGAPEYDNSNAQMAVLGVWAAARRGVEVPPEYWQLVEQYWTDQQQPDGGWGYFIPPNARKVKTYGSMTAAGLATLFICYDSLHNDDFVRCTGQKDSRPIGDGLKWLADNFAAGENPRLGVNRYYYWLYCMERVGLSSGYKYFGGHDWYRLGAEGLLSRQNAEGSWDYADERVVATAFAMLFLARGRDGVMMNKLSFAGKWNTRPRDLSNLARWVSYNFERPVKWQVVGIDSPMEDWLDSPILYLSGSGPAEFTPAQADKLRQFVLRGGTILSEAACNSGDFTLDMQRLYKRIFPQYALERLPDDHAIYTNHFQHKGTAGVQAVSNGVRPLAIHCPRELSLALQMGPSKLNTPGYELATNLYFFVTDSGSLRPYGQDSWPAAKPFTPRATITLTRLKFKGNYDPEPLAWQRLAVLIGNAHQVKLEVSAPLDIAELDARKHPLASLCGTGKFDLTDAQAKAMKEYLAGGGKLIVEAVGGSKEFSESFEQQVLGLYPQGEYLTLSLKHEIYRAPEPIDRVAYRANYANVLGGDRNAPRIKALLDGKRVVAIFSGEDLTSGLLGTSPYHLRGYSAATAVAMATNMVWFMSDTPAAKPQRDSQ